MTDLLIVPKEFSLAIPNLPHHVLALALRTRWLLTRCCVCVSLWPETHENTSLFARQHCMCDCLFGICVVVCLYLVCRHAVSSPPSRAGGGGSWRIGSSKRVKRERLEHTSNIHASKRSKRKRCLVVIFVWFICYLHLTPPWRLLPSLPSLCRAKEAPPSNGSCLIMFRLPGVCARALLPKRTIFNLGCSVWKSGKINP